MGFYIEITQNPNGSGVAGETIPVGTLVQKNADGTVTLVDDSSTDFDGVADMPHTADYIADDKRSASNFEYVSTGSAYALGGGADTVPYGGGYDGDVIKVKTILDSGDVDDDAVAISDDTVVGVAQLADADYHGRVVQEGYSDGTTTYNRANGNFIAVGKALRDSADGYDQTVRVQVRKSLN